MEVQEAGKKWKQLEVNIMQVTQELIDEFERETGMNVVGLTIRTNTHEALGQPTKLVIVGVNASCVISKT